MSRRVSDKVWSGQLENGLETFSLFLLAMDRGSEVAVGPCSDEEVKTWLRADRLIPNVLPLIYAAEDDGQLKRPVRHFCYDNGCIMTFPADWTWTVSRHHTGNHAVARG